MAMTTISRKLNLSHLLLVKQDDASKHTLSVLYTVFTIWKDDPERKSYLVSFLRRGAKWSVQISDMEENILGWLCLPENIDTRYKDNPFTKDGQLRENSDKELNNWKEMLREDLVEMHRRRNEVKDNFAPCEPYYQPAGMLRGIIPKSSSTDELVKSQEEGDDISTK